MSEPEYQVRKIDMAAVIVGGCFVLYAICSWFGLTLAICVLGVVMIATGFMNDDERLKEWKKNHSPDQRREAGPE